jgi:hypothetical protein
MITASRGHGTGSGLLAIATNPDKGTKMMANKGKLQLVVLSTIIAIVLVILLFLNNRIQKQPSSSRSTYSSGCQDFLAELAKPPEEYTYATTVDKDNEMITAEDRLSGQIQEVCKSSEGSYLFILDSTGREWRVFAADYQAQGLAADDCVDATVLRSDSGNSFLSPAEVKAHLPRFTSVQRAACKAVQPAN